MQLEDAYPVIVADRLAACRDLYVGQLGFEIVFEATWFAYLKAGDRGPGIAFMAADYPSQPPGPQTFGGEGVFLTLQVGDAAAEFERLRAAGLEFDYELRDEPWGQRRFGLKDPAGLLLDVVEQIDPAPGYWEQYTV